MIMALLTKINSKERDLFTLYKIRVAFCYFPMALNSGSVLQYYADA